MSQLGSQAEGRIPPPPACRNIQPLGGLDVPTTSGSAARITESTDANANLSQKCLEGQTQR